jgi:hypothetical protein
MSIGVLSVAAIALSYSITFLRNRPSAVQAAATELAQSAIQSFTSSGQVGRALDPYIPAPTPPQAPPSGFYVRGILPDTRILTAPISNPSQPFITDRVRGLVFPTGVPVSSQFFAAGRQRRFVDVAAIGETGATGYIAPVEPTPAGVSPRIVATSNSQFIVNVANLAQAMYNCGWTGSACESGLPDFCAGNDSSCPMGGINVTDRIFSLGERDKSVKSVCLRIRPFNLSTNQEYPAGTCPRPLVSGPRGLMRNSQRTDSRHASYVNADVNLGYRMTAVATVVGAGSDGQLKDIIGQASFVAAHVSDRTPPGRPQVATVTDGQSTNLSTRNWTVCNEFGPTPAAIANYNRTRITLPFSPVTGTIEPGVVALCRTYTRHTCRPSATDWVVSSWHPCDQLRFEYTDGVVPGYTDTCATTSAPSTVAVDTTTVTGTGGTETNVGANPRLEFQTFALQPQYNYNVEYAVIDPAGNKSLSQCINTPTIVDAGEFPCINGPGFFVDSLRPVAATQVSLADQIGPPEDGIAGRNNIPDTIVAPGFNWWTTVVQCNNNPVTFHATVDPAVSIQGITGCSCLPANEFSSCTWNAAARRCEGVYAGVGGVITHGRKSTLIFPVDSCSFGSTNAGFATWEVHLTPPLFSTSSAAPYTFQNTSSAPFYPIDVVPTGAYAAEAWSRWVVKCDCNPFPVLHVMQGGVPGGSGLAESCPSSIEVGPQGCTSASFTATGYDVCGRSATANNTYQVLAGLGDPCGGQACGTGLNCATSSQYLSSDSTPSRITGMCYSGGGSSGPIGSVPPNANPVCPVRGTACVSTPATSANNSSCGVPTFPTVLLNNGFGSGVHTHANNRQYAISLPSTPWTDTRAATWSCRWAGTKTVYIDQKETRYCHDTLVIPKSTLVSDVPCSTGVCESGRGTCPNPTPGNPAAGSLCVLGSAPNTGCIDSPTPPPLSGYAYVVVGGANYVDPFYSGVPLNPTPPGGFTYGYPMVTPGGTATFKWYALNEDPGASYMHTEHGSMGGIRNSTDNTAVYSSGNNRLQYIMSPGGNEQWYLMDASNFLPWGSFGVERSVTWTMPSDYMQFTAPHVQGGSYTNAVVVLRFKPKGYNGQGIQWGAGISIPTPTPRPVSGYLVATVGGVNYVDPDFPVGAMNPTPPGGFTVGYPVVNYGSTVTFKWLGLNEDASAPHYIAFKAIRTSTNGTTTFGSGGDLISLEAPYGVNGQMFAKATPEFAPYGTGGVQRTYTWTVPPNYAEFAATHIKPNSNGASRQDAVAVVRFYVGGDQGTSTHYGAGITLPTPTPPVAAIAVQFPPGVGTNYTEFGVPNPTPVGGNWSNASVPLVTPGASIGIRWNSSGYATSPAPAANLCFYMGGANAGPPAGGPTTFCSGGETLTWFGFYEGLYSYWCRNATEVNPAGASGVERTATWTPSAACVNSVMDYFQSRGATFFHTRISLSVYDHLSQPVGGSAIVRWTRSPTPTPSAPCSPNATLLEQGCAFSSSGTSGPDADTRCCSGQSITRYSSDSNCWMGGYYEKLCGTDPYPTTGGFGQSCTGPYEECDNGTLSCIQCSDGGYVVKRCLNVGTPWGNCP